MGYSVKDVKLGVTSRTANGIVVFARENGIDGLVVRALPYFDRAGRKYRAVTICIYKCTRAVGFESGGVFFAEFFGREAVIFGYYFAVAVSVLEFSIPRIAANVVADINGAKAEARIDHTECDDERGEGVGKIDRSRAAHRMSDNKHSFREVVMLDCISVSLIKRKNMLGTSHSESVRSTSADVKSRVSRTDAFGSIAETAKFACLLADGVSCAVAGEDELSRLAVFGICVGKAENSLAFRPLLAVKHFVCGRTRNVAEIVEFYFKKYL